MSKVKQRSSVTLSSNTLSQFSLSLLTCLPVHSLTCILKKGYRRSNILFLRIYFSKVCRTHETCVPMFYMLLTMNHCLPDEPSQMMHRDKPLHGG